MKQYVLWEQVQRQLTEHAAATGKPYSFYDAVRELWYAEQFQFAPELPPVFFADWDAADLDRLAQLLGQAPVDLDIFYQNFRKDHDVTTSTQHIHHLDIHPLRIARDQAMGLHVHDAFEVGLVLRGEAQLACGPHRHKLPAGSCYLVGPRTEHDAMAGKDCLLLSIAMAEQNVEDTLYKLLRQDNVLADFFRAGLGGERGGYLLFTIPELSGVLPTLKGILQEYYAQDEYSRDVCVDYLEILFAYMLRHGSDYFQRRRFHTARHGTTALLAVLRHIQTNFRTTSLAETAALFHYEPGYLSKQLRAYTGKNYTDLVIGLRTEGAKQLLRDTDLSIEAVGERMGYSSLVHFSRSFKTATGLSPRAYRAENR